MAKVDEDYVKNVASKDVVQTHEPPPIFTDINTQAMQNSHQNQTQQLFVHQNGQMIPVIVVTNGMNGHLPYGGPIVNVRDYMVWSIVNILCCGLWLGLCALPSEKICD